MEKKKEKNNFRTPPVHVDEEYDVTIVNVGEKGDGVAKIQDFIVFVPGAKKGQNCRIKITRVLPKVGFAIALPDETETWDYEDETIMEETR